MNQLMNQLDGPLFYIFLVGTAIYLTFFLNIPQSRYWKESWKLFFQGKDLKNLATSMTGSIGIGTVIGVSIAIHTGGPSAIFWMWITAFFGMALRLGEVFLSHHYRIFTKEGHKGGAMYFLPHKKGGKVMAVLYALGTIFSCICANNMSQAKALGEVSINIVSFSINQIGFFLAFLVAAVLIGGLTRIEIVAEKLLPIMSLLFFFLSLSIIIFHLKKIPSALYLITKDAFSGSSIVGGFLGTSFTTMIVTGVGFGYYTNDAGLGSAGIAHASNSQSTSRQTAILSMIEPFVATCIFCTFTALTLLCEGSWQEKKWQQLDPSRIKVTDSLKNNKKETALLFFEKGILQNDNCNLIYQNSVVEKLLLKKNGKNFTGNLQSTDGSIIAMSDNITCHGYALLSAEQAAIYSFTNGKNDKGWRIWLFLLCILLFGFTTIISGAYYGESAVCYLFPDNKTIVLLYRLCYVVAVFLGTVKDSSLIWNLALVSCALMGIPNLIALWLFRNEIKEHMS